MPADRLKPLRPFLRWVNPHRPGRGPSPWKLFLFWNPATALIFTLALGGPGSILARFLLSWVISNVVASTIFTLVHLFLALKRLSFRVRRLPAPPFNRGAIACVAILGMLPGLYLGFLVAGAVARRLHLPWDAPQLSDYTSGCVFGLLLFIIFTLVDIWRGAAEARAAAELRVKDLENSRLQAQIAALTAQMNPHLLFNALNTIASLIPENPQAAEEITVRLSELYRGVLDASRRATHSLAQELDLCRAYLAIEQSRFGNRLTSRIDVDSEVAQEAIQVPALLLQPLVENAVKHGIAPRASGGSVLIRARREMQGIRIFIEDDGMGFGKSLSKSGAGLGVANCRSRLELTYGAHGRLLFSARPGGGTAAELSLPFFERTENA